MICFFGATGCSESGPKDDLYVMHLKPGGDGVVEYWSNDYSTTPALHYSIAFAFARARFA